jgi:hypothetical protein
MNTKYTLVVTLMNAKMNIGKRLYTILAPDFECACAFAKADLSINGLRTLDIELFVAKGE